MSAAAYFFVHATVPEGREDEFNTWYEQEHIPKTLRYPGIASAHRYRLLDSGSGDPGSPISPDESKYRYLVVYEFQDEATLRGFLKSPYLKELKADFDSRFQDSVRQRFLYSQVWP